jgi:predicted DNA-binding protein with PD1-like motif
MKYIFLLIAILFIQCKPSQKMQASTVKIHAFRLKPGADLRKSIQAYVAEHNIQAGYMITCVGSLTQTHLRYANQPKGTQLKGFFEIVSLVGTVSISGNHLHLSTSDSIGKTIGGHLLEDNLVYTTAEIVIGESKNLVFTREKDGTTPWEELQIKN